MLSIDMWYVRIGKSVIQGFKNLNIEKIAFKVVKITVSA